MSLEGKRFEKNLQLILYAGIELHNKITKSKFFNENLDAIINIHCINTLAIIYPLANEETKQKIVSLVQDYQWEINNDSLYSIHLLAQNNIIAIDTETEKNILDYVQNLEDDRNTTINGKYEQMLSYITNLYIEDHLKDKESFEKFIKQNGDAFWKLIIDTQNFDYAKFKLEWLKCLPVEFLEKLNVNGDVTTRIQQKVREEYLKGYLDDDTIKIFFEHFIVKKI